MKLLLKVNLKTSETIYKAGTVYEGELSSFPLDIQTDYAAGRWDILEIVTLENPLPAAILDGVSSKSIPKKNKKSVSVIPGIPVSSPTSVDESNFSKNQSVKNENNVLVDEGELKGDTIEVEAIVAQAKKKIVKKSSLKMKFDKKKL